MIIQDFGSDEDEIDFFYRSVDKIKEFCFYKICRLIDLYLAVFDHFGVVEKLESRAFQQHQNSLKTAKYKSIKRQILWKNLLFLPIDL